jgi:hypothetical protein
VIFQLFSKLGGKRAEKMKREIENKNVFLVFQFFLKFSKFCQLSTVNIE